ncbi:galanin-like peptide isoform X1 [Mesocricetus auratus]|uniref:Galanin-like peptide n=1 Tax=Mesocricetus auratus TaxID=10036 RepID=A0ABM2WGH0_MESAU|nr:galanin-like peptide isoform X1 [Mesocricetus auratus]
MSLLSASILTTPPALGSLSLTTSLSTPHSPRKHKSQDPQSCRVLRTPHSFRQLSAVFFRFRMACSPHLVLLVTILMTLAGTQESAPVYRGRGGWTLNSAGYLLGPVLHLPSKVEQGRKRDSALEILDLWKAIDELPYSHSPKMTKRTLVETFVKPKSEDLRELDREEASLRS